MTPPKPTPPSSKPPKKLVNGEAAVAAALALTEGMGELSKDIQGLRDYGHRNRMMIRGLVVSLVFDIVLSLVLGFVAVKARDASHQASKATSSVAINRNNIHSSCLATNQAKAAEKALWDKVFTFPPPKNETADTKMTREQQTAQFKTFLNETFKPERC